MSRVNIVCSSVINYLSWKWHELSKARWYNFVPAFWKLANGGGTEIVQACDSCCVPGFYASIVLAFISEAELFDYMGGICKNLAAGESKMGDVVLMQGESNR